MRLPKFIRADILTLFFALTAFLALIPVITYLYFAKDLVSQEKIMNKNDTGVILLDSNSEAFFNFYQARNRSYLPLSKIPKITQQAIISSEDKDFYKHPGFSIRSIVRSLIGDIIEGKIKYGGSTITQQLIKNALLSPQKNFLRKYQELILAQELERRYNKDEILEMYLNSIYFGEGSFGIEEAAQTYFNKSADQLNLAEGSFLVGLLPSPSTYSPFSGDVYQAKKRQEIVLEKMYQQNYISLDEMMKTKDEQLRFVPNKQAMNNTATHFALLVKDQLIKQYGEEEIARSGFKVKTSINLNWQKTAEQAIKNHIENLAKNNVTNGSIVVIDPKTGHIKVLVGSKDWFNDEFGKVNMATSPRQPGSSFKPIVYLAGFEKNLITPSTILQDKPQTFKSDNVTNANLYNPKNYDGKFRGPVTVRRSLANSLNVPSVEVMSKVGIPDSLEIARRLGISSLQNPSDYGLSLVLGAGEVSLLEMTDVYATFANQGNYNPPTAILEIYDKSNQKIYQYNPTPEQVVDPKYVFLVSSILSDNITRAEVFGNNLTISRPAAVKTGTTENFRDAWTLGYTPDLAVGVWIGNNDGKLMDNIAGSLGAAPLWKLLMEKYHQGVPITKFNPPDGVLALNICKNNGLLLRENSSQGFTEYFVSGTEPKAFCSLPSPSPVANKDKKTR